MTSTAHNSTNTNRPAATVVSIAAGGHRERVLARRDQLVKDHIDLVRQVAEVLSRQLPPSFDMSDLISAGNMGLMKAAIRYRPDVNGGVPFRLYAREVIRGAILDSVNRRHYLENTRPEITEDIEPLEENVIDISIDRERRLTRIREAMNYLEPRKKAILKRYYGEDSMTFDGIGRELGLSRSHTGELHAEAIGELKKLLHVA